MKGKEKEKEKNKKRKEKERKEGGKKKEKRKKKRKKRKKRKEKEMEGKRKGKKKRKEKKGSTLNNFQTMKIFLKNEKTLTLSCSLIPFLLNLFSSNHISLSSVLIFFLKTKYIFFFNFLSFLFIFKTELLLTSPQILNFNLLQISFKSSNSSSVRLRQ